MLQKNTKRVLFVKRTDCRSLVSTTDSEVLVVDDESGPTGDQFEAHAEPDRPYGHQSAERPIDEAVDDSGAETALHMALEVLGVTLSLNHSLNHLSARLLEVVGEAQELAAVDEQSGRIEHFPPFLLAVGVILRFGSIVSIGDKV